VAKKKKNFFFKIIILHSKNKRCFTEPAKKVPEISKSVQSLKKSMKPLKVLPVYPREEPSPAKPFFKFRTAEKGLYKALSV